ncbi:MAG: T9SS type A sorting domain-containing protein [Bacteroidales bacterium]|nr:T9SS type A sorting domain-containing protein [Bacteroidales bacterium]
MDCQQHHQRHEVRPTANGYELWMSCLGRGIAVLDVVTGTVGVQESASNWPETSMTAKPNPASEKVDISFLLKNSGRANLSVYDLHGRLVKELSNETMEKGVNTIQWDLLNQSGSMTGKGVYIARLTADGNTESIKIVVR